MATKKTKEVPAVKEEQVLDNTNDVKTAELDNLVLESFDNDDFENLSEQKNNLDLLMSVPLQLSVEIGRVNVRIEEILSFTSGTVVQLDKNAGEDAEIFANGKCIARGSIVVIDDNYGIKITEIIKNEEMISLV